MGNEFPLRVGISARLRAGVAAATGSQRKDGLGAERGLVDLVVALGALPLILVHSSASSTAAALAAAAIDQVDALLLQGGSDVSPHWYGGSAASADPGRDEFELALLRAALAQGKPVLGICRGCQLLNVAHGGSLIADLAPAATAPRLHDDPVRYDEHAHAIELRRDGLLARQYGVVDGWVSSAHRQGIDRLGDGLVAEAWCRDDGLIEAVRSIDGWAVGVQWHPEFHAARPSLLPAAPLFQAFLGAARVQPARAHG